MAVLERTSRRGANNTNQDGNPPRSLLLLRFMPFALLRPVSRKQRGKRIEQEITTNEGSRTRASEKNLTNPPNSEHRKIPEARTGQERTPQLNMVYKKTYPECMKIFLYCLDFFLGNAAVWSCFEKSRVMCITTSRNTPRERRKKIKAFRWDYVGRKYNKKRNQTYPI
jgi:hypothetical protein